MTDPLTPARFSALAEAYGSIARWPEAVRDEAWTMASRPELAALLAEAEALDARLDRWTIDAPSPVLRTAILAQRHRSLARRLKLWWSAIGLSTALAGAVAGSFAMMTLPVDHPPADETAFGSLAAQEE